MATNIILVMSNLVKNSPGGRYCLSSEDLVQISRYSNIVWSKNFSNFTIQLCSIKFYQQPKLLCQIFKI